MKVIAGQAPTDCKGYISFGRFGVKTRLGKEVKA